MNLIWLWFVALSLVMNITLEEIGARLYVTGNSYPIKDSIKAAGGHWDTDRRQWWVGKVKRPAMEAAITKASGKADEITDRTEVRGKVSYKGKGYYLLCSAKDGSSHKVCTLDGTIVFWTKKEERAQITKHYNNDRGSYPTLGGIRAFIAQAKKEEKEPDSVERRPCWECGGLYSRREIRDGEWFSHNDSKGNPMCYCGC